MIGLSMFFASQDNPALPSVSLEQVMVITQYVLMMNGLSNELDWAMAFVVRAIASANRLYKIIFDVDRGEFMEGNQILDDKPTIVEFDNVSFHYKGSNNDVLRNLSFTIKENETFAIVGGPGSGKSTLTKLIQRM